MADQNEVKTTQQEGPDPGLDPQLVQFIFQHIRSLGELEILICFQNSPNFALSPQEVYEAVKSNQHFVETQLKRFCSAGLLQKEGTNYRLNPDNSELNLRIQELKKSLRERPVRVIEVIIRSQDSPINDFANAFKLKKD
jgi:hypothetical protein